MPARGGRVGGGGSRGVRSGGFRAPRSSSVGGSRGVRLGFGNRTPRTTSNVSSQDASPSHRVPYRPWIRRGGVPLSAEGWGLGRILLILFVLGACGVVGVGITLLLLGAR